jgi:hypothetical protein
MRLPGDFVLVRGPSDLSLTRLSLTELTPVLKAIGWPVLTFVVPLAEGGQ